MILGPEPLDELPGGALPGDLRPVDPLPGDSRPVDPSPTDPRPADPVPGVAAIIPCRDVDAAESWWLRLGFVGDGGAAYGDYRILDDGRGGSVHLITAVDGWLVPGRNPFGVYVYTPRVDELAQVLREEIIEGSRAPEHKEWGMYEFAVNGPDDLFVRVGWPSRLVR